MKAERFDDLARELLSTPSRRGLFAGLTGGLLTVLLYTPVEHGSVKKKRNLWCSLRWRRHLPGRDVFAVLHRQELLR